MVTEATNEDWLRVVDSSRTFSIRMRKLNQLRKNRTFCDVILQVENAEIHGHRCVIASASPYFFELFVTDDDAKSASEDKLIFKLNGFEYESVERLVEYAYTGELHVPPDDAKSLYITASKLKMDEIRHVCGQFLMGTLTPETCLEMRNMTSVSDDETLIAAIDDYIQKQEDIAHVTESAQSVPKILLNVIHASKDEAEINIRALCCLALDWIKQLIENEQQTLFNLSNKTHLLYLSSDNSLRDCSEIENGAVNDSEMVQDYKKISRKLSQSNIKNKKKTSGLPQPVKPRMMLFSRSISEDDHNNCEWKLIAYSKVAENSVISVVSVNGATVILSLQRQLNVPESKLKHSQSPSLEKVDSYTSILHMSYARCSCGVGVADGKLIVCGGYDRGECLDQVECFDSNTNEWRNMKCMLESRGRFDMTAIDDKLYAIGGCNGTMELSSVEVFDLKRDKWKSLSPLRLARSNAGVCNLKGLVYCVGGWNGQFGIRQCDVFNPRSNSWNTISSLNEGRYQAGVTSLSDKIYAVGGCDSWNCLNSVEVYDSTLDEWKHVLPMPTARRGCGVAAFKGHLYVVGGSDGTHSLCTTEIYDPEENKWTSGPSMTTCRANVAVAVIDNRLYAVGGFSGKNFLNSIEFLDGKTNEWTTFTPKTNMMRSKSPKKAMKNKVSHNDKISTVKNGHLENGFKVQNGDKNCLKENKDVDNSCVTIQNEVNGKVCSFQSEPITINRLNKGYGVH